MPQLRRDLLDALGRAEASMPARIGQATPLLMRLLAFDRSMRGSPYSRK